MAMFLLERSDVTCIHNDPPEGKNLRVGGTCDWRIGQPKWCPARKDPLREECGAV